MGALEMKLTLASLCPLSSPVEWMESFWKVSKVSTLTELVFISPLFHHMGTLHRQTSYLLPIGPPTLHPDFSARGIHKPWERALRVEVNSTEVDFIQVPLVDPLCKGQLRLPNSP